MIRPTPLATRWPLALLCLAALSACQGGNRTPTASTPESRPAPAPAALIEPGSPGAPGQSTWGIARLDIDLARQSVELTPVRSASAKGDAYTLDATGFFTSNPCIDCMRLTGFGRVLNAPDQLRVDVQIRHPFPATNVRKDLDVFDPRIVLINARDDERAPLLFPGTPGADTDRDGNPEELEGNLDILANADGYTTHFDKRAEEVLGLSLPGNLNPYKNYYTDLFPDDPNVFIRNPFHRMAQNSPPETQSFHITFPPLAQRLEYYLILQVSWGVAATKETRLVPTYYLPEFNQKEAFKVEVADITRSLTDDPLSFTVYEIQVADWQAYGEVNASYPDPVRTDYIPGFSDAEQVWIECPALSSIAFTTSTRLSGIGQEPDPWRFQVTVSNTNGAAPGLYPALVTVRDTRDGQVQSVPDLNLGYTNDVRAYRVVNLRVQSPTVWQPKNTLTNTTLLIGHGPPSYANTFAPRGDLAVFNNGAGLNGVLLWDYSSGTVLRYSLDYSTLTSYGGAATPFNDYPGTMPHPQPAGPMPVARIAAADNGSYVLLFADDNFSFNPTGLPGSILTRPLPMSDFAAFYVNDNGVVLPGPRFIGGCGSDGTVPAPTFGERMLGVWSNPSVGGYQHSLGFMSGGATTERCGATLDYVVLGAPYSSSASSIRQVSGNGNVAFDIPPTLWLSGFKNADAGTRRPDGSQALYMLVEENLYTFNSREGITSNNVASPSPASFSTRPLLDPINDIGLETVDLKVLNYNPAIVRNHAGVGQVNDWLALLLRDQSTGEGVLRIYDLNGFVLLQEIDSRGGGGPMGSYVTSLDIDNYTYDIHVAMNSAGPAFGDYVVTVFELVP